eukprot:GDKI01006748.1.p1 GENE.GDKI01006748.1~~GDKI01006748.1.p1  ORF type:complete len:106 (-),score=33.79 GDKI01006748.1:6-323(-)
MHTHTNTNHWQQYVCCIPNRIRVIEYTMKHIHTHTHQPISFAVTLTLTHTGTGKLCKPLHEARKNTHAHAHSHTHAHTHIYMRTKLRGNTDATVGLAQNRTHTCT